jgi:hypothetical protein
MRALPVLALSLAAAAPAGARDLDCRAETVCRNAACAPVEAGDASFRLLRAEGPDPAILRGGERVALRARVAAGAAMVRFEGINAAGRAELVILTPGTLTYRHTTDAQRRNAPVWSGRCAAALP